jgi:hypothetical protein
MPRIPAINPPITYAVKYITPSILLSRAALPDLNMDTKVITGLKWEPEIYKPNRVMTQKPRSMPIWWSPNRI